MERTLQRFYRRTKTEQEICFNIETNVPLTPKELKTLQWLLAETFEPEKFSKNSLLKPDGKKIIEIGPRMNFETPFSTNAVAICHAIGLTKVTRIERSRRYAEPVDTKIDSFIVQNCDRMTECHYPKPLATFQTGIQPKSVYVVPLIEKEIDALREINAKMGLGMDEWDLQFYYDLFVRDLKRNPTDVELFQIGQANSEHSRHHFFRSKLLIDDVTISKTLMEIIKETLVKNPNKNSVIAFSDNSSAIRGYEIWTIVPKVPGTCSPFSRQKCTYHILFTAETHNHPSGSAFSGSGNRHWWKNS